MTAHLSAEQLERFATGRLDDRELDEVLLHLEVCEVCGSAGTARASGDVARLRETLTETSAGGAAGRPARWIAVAAAAAVAAVLAGALLLRRTAPQPPRRDPAPVVVQQPAPRPAPAPAPQRAPRPAYADAVWQRLVERAVASGTLPFPADLASLQAPADTVRGSSEAAPRVEPSGVVLDDVRPAFTWPAGEGTYTVSVFDEAEEVIRSAPLTVTRWRPQRDLPRGRTLAWQVEVSRDGAIETIPRPPAPPALFRIVSAAEHRELQRARAAHPGDALLHAVLYARAGMRREALAALGEAAKTNAAAERILHHATKR